MQPYQARYQETIKHNMNNLKNSLSTSMFDIYSLKSDPNSPQYTHTHFVTMYIIHKVNPLKSYTLIVICKSSMLEFELNYHYQKNNIRHALKNKTSQCHKLKIMSKEKLSNTTIL